MEEDPSEKLKGMSLEDLATYCDDILASRPVPFLLLAVVGGLISPTRIGRLRIENPGLGLGVDVDPPDPVLAIERLMENDTAASMVRSRQRRRSRIR